MFKLKPNWKRKPLFLEALKPKISVYSELIAKTSVVIIKDNLKNKQIIFIYCKQVEYFNLLIYN